MALPTVWVGVKYYLHHGWVDGSHSLAAESLNLRAMALPKDFSPLTICVPLNVKGSFANAQVSLDKKHVGLKLAT